MYVLLVMECSIVNKLCRWGKHELVHVTVELIGKLGYVFSSVFYSLIFPLVKEIVRGVV